MGRKRQVKPGQSMINSYFLDSKDGPSTQKRSQTNSIETRFLQCCEVGDIPTVRKLVVQHPEFNFNCTDILGRTPLRLAVENEHLEIVEILLDKTEPQRLYDALLLAISMDHTEIAMKILRHPTYQSICIDITRAFLRGNDDSLFASDTTPIILASQRNLYEIVSFLIQQGEIISDPHKDNCECKTCKRLMSIDALRFAKSRLNAFKGLASESYICLSSEDPILTAFILKRRLYRNAEREKHYREEYETLRKGLGDFLVKLLDEVRGDAELDVILNGDIQDEDDDEEILSRLKLALHYNEKKFVSHPSCQKKLTTYWYGEFFRYFKRLPSWAMSLNPLLLTLCYPMLIIIYWIAPNSKPGKLMKIPYVKFIGQILMFFVFLVMIMVVTLNEKPSSGIVLKYLEPGWSTGNRNIPDSKDPWEASYLLSEWIIQNTENITFNLTDMTIMVEAVITSHMRHHVPQILQLVISWFLLGMLWNECKQVAESGFTSYFSNVYNLVDYVMLILYATSFTLRFLTFIKTAIGLSYFDHPSKFAALMKDDPVAMYQWYWLMADRYYWDTVDPMNICEGLFAVANVLSFCRLFHILAANETLGPLQISLLRMISDVSRFMVIFFIVIAAFLVGLNNLYWYYALDVRTPVEFPGHGQLSTNAEESFGTLELTFQTVFWSLFGMGESNAVSLGESYNKGFTERVGYVVYGAYNIAAVIVLLNMLIAMMSRSFDMIQDDEDLEWKYARGELYMEFIQSGNTLPYPFNIIPSPKSIVRLCISIVKTCCCCCRQEEEESEDVKIPPQFPVHNALARRERSSSVSTTTSEASTTIHRIQDKLKRGISMKRLLLGDGKQHQTKLSYQTVMKRVVNRFIFNSQQTEQSPVEGELEEIKQDLSSFRFEMMNEVDSQRRTILGAFQELTLRLDILIPKEQRPKSQNSFFNSELNNRGFEARYGTKFGRMDKGSGLRSVPEESNVPGAVYGRLPPDAQNVQSKKIYKYVANVGYITDSDYDEDFCSDSDDSSYCNCEECVTNFQIAGIPPSKEKHGGGRSDDADTSSPGPVGKFFSRVFGSKKPENKDSDDKEKKKTKTKRKSGKRKRKSSIPDDVDLSSDEDDFQGLPAPGSIILERLSQHNMTLDSDSSNVSRNGHINRAYEPESVSDDRSLADCAGSSGTGDDSLAPIPTIKHVGKYNNSDEKKSLAAKSDEGYFTSSFAQSQC